LLSTTEIEIKERKCSNNSDHLIPFLKCNNDDKCQEGAREKETMTAAMKKNRRVTSIHQKNGIPNINNLHDCFGEMRRKSKKKNAKHFCIMQE